MSLLLRRALLSSLSGGVDNSIYNETFSARNFSSSPLAIPLTLEGDTYDYQLVCFFASASGDSIMDITLNSDTTANYRNYEMKGLSGTANAAMGNADTAIELQNLIGTANPNFLMMDITQSSGRERVIDSFYSGDGAVLKQTSYWKNTANELDEITLTAASSVTCDAHIILYQLPKAADQGNWEYISELDWSAETAIKSFTGLDGDVDKKYKLVFSGSNIAFSVRINSDSGANYKQQYLRNSLGSVQSGFGNFPYLYTNAASTDSEYIFHAETGVKRLIEGNITSTGTGYKQVESICWYSNTATNITSINCNTHSSNLTGKATLFKLKDTSITGDTLGFTTLDSEDFSSDDFSSGTTHTIYGDSIKLLKIEGLLSNASGDIEIRMQLNSDTAANYPEQLLKADTSSTSAASSTRSYIVLAKLQNTDQAEFTHYLYTNSGENRVGLTRCSYDENAIEKLGQHWLNSADEITSVKIYASSSNAITGNIKVSTLT